MNEIYKQKAEKYKNKYLKLKQELYGGDGQYEYEYNNCISNPPIYFDLNKFYILKNNEEFDRLNDKKSAEGKILIKENYSCDKTININSFLNNYNYVGRLIKSKTNKFYNYDDEYEIELTNTNNNYEIIKSLQILGMLQHIPKIVYACRIINDKSTTYNALKGFFKNCTKSTNSTRYGYIITKNMGKSINIYMKISDLIQFIPNLIDAIRNFIIPLNNASYFLKNIALKNIYWDENRRKVFFNNLI